MALQVVLWFVFAVGLLLIAANWMCLIQSHVQKKHISMVPPLGAVLAWAASSGLPIGWKLGALALVLDPACGLLLVGAAVVGVLRWFRRRSIG
ncbi:MAG: hypothetical protein JO257_18640 [Deltaproteobacteria bacterium]|nr:hypothetical protein [Deltaproteobacteria bacterium]